MSFHPPKARLMIHVAISSKLLSESELRGFAPTCREPPGRAIGMLEWPTSPAYSAVITSGNRLAKSVPTSLHLLISITHQSLQAWRNRNIYLGTTPNKHFDSANQI